MGKATRDLIKEHEVILSALEILEKMMRSDKEPAQLLRSYEQVVYFLKTFADKCHHGKEESLLFKAMVEKGIPDEGGPVGVMLEEHVQGREYIAEMTGAIAAQDFAAFRRAGIPYCILLRHHIDKENNALFVMADQVLSEQEQDDLFEKFEEFEETVIGGGVHEQLHAMLEEWAVAFA